MLMQRFKKNGQWLRPHSLLMMFLIGGVLTLTISNFRVMNRSYTYTEVLSSSIKSETTSTFPPISVPVEKEKYRFAYAFLIAGCKPENPTYRGYIYNIAIAKEILKEFNSTADVVVMVRMHVDTDHEKLPPGDEDILTKTGVIVKYIPKPLTDNFHTAMMDKFRILELTDYDRVLYLDSDVLPLNNLDYMFEKSIGPNAKLLENVVLAYNHEPSSGGFFMLKPDKEDYLEIIKIIERRESEGYDFNETIGFGHVITPPDYWESLVRKGDKWTFYGAFTDQGLLYHWTKYTKKKVTMITGKSVKSLEAVEDGDTTMVREEASRAIFGDVKRYSSLSFLQRVSNAPYRDFKHFTQRTKPWFKKVAQNPPKDVEKIDQATNANQLWYHMLRRINKKYKLDIDAENLKENFPILGLYPTFEQVMNANDRKQEKE